jgi:multidrug efflux pump subunit AcrB
MIPSPDPLHPLRSPFRISFCFLVLSALGLFTLPYQDIDLLPRDQSRQLSISCRLPNASPAGTEAALTQLLENAFSGMANLHEMNSVSRYDESTVDLVFRPGTDMDYARFEAAAVIRRIYKELPANASYPTIEQAASDRDDKTRSDEKPLLIYSITAAAMPFAIKTAASTFFRRELAAFTDLKEIRLSGTEDLQATLSLDLARCKAYGISWPEVKQSIQAYMKESYPGFLQIGHSNSYAVKIAAEEVDLSGLLKIPIQGTAQRLLIQDIGHLYLEEQPVTRYFRVNGKNSIRMMLYPRAGTNRLRLAEELKHKMSQLVDQLPAGYHTRLEHDDSRFFAEELYKNYRRSIGALVILIFFLLISYRSWRMLTVLFLSLIMNLCLTALCAWALGIPIHMYSLAGLSISFGIMIDNSIVSLDYFHQYRSRHIILAILGATLTTIAALLLVFLLPESLKKNLTDFALMVSVSLAVSIVVALFCTPALYLVLYPQKHNTMPFNMVEAESRMAGYYYRVISFLARFRKTFILLSILLFGLPVFMLPTRWEGHAWYNNSLGHESYLENIRPWVDRILGGSLRLFVRDVYEKSGYRDPQKTMLYVSARMKYGTTILQMNTILSEFEKYLADQEGIDQYITSVYSGQNGSIAISFQDDYIHTALPWQLKNRITSKATDWSAVEWGIYGVGQGFSTYQSDQIPSYRVLMKGYNYEELEKQAMILEQKLRRHPRIQKVNINERLSWDEQSSFEYLVQPIQDQLALKGIHSQQLFKALTELTQSQPSGLAVYVHQKRYPLVIKNQSADTYDLWDIRNKNIPIDSNRFIRAGDFTRIDLQKTSSAIHKQDRSYIRLVAFEYMGSAFFGGKYFQKVLDEMKSILPIGYTAQEDTWHWTREQTKKQYSILILLILANFFICALLFENLRLPFYIILTIPISFIGLFLIFSWGGFYFDQGGYAAFVMLGGLVVNAAIFIVHDFIQARREGDDTNRTLMRVCTNRARTIWLTTVSAICSLLPFIYEGQQEIFWFSLAIGVMGGLVFSMYAVFIVLPVLMWKRY